MIVTAYLAYVLSGLLLIPDSACQRLCDRTVASHAGDQELHADQRK